MVKLHIRWLIGRDMCAVLKIEKESSVEPWIEEEFNRILRERNVIGMVTEVGEKVVGFMIYELHKTRLHLVNLAVAPTYRRLGQHEVGHGEIFPGGIGTAMINRLVGKLSSHRRNAISLDIRESNLEGQLFFKRQGFHASQVLRRFFEDTGEDAYHMQYVLPGESWEQPAAMSEEEEEYCEGV